MTPSPVSASPAAARSRRSHRRSSNRSTRAAAQMYPHQPGQEDVGAAVALDDPADDASPGQDIVTLRRTPSRSAARRRRRSCRAAPRASTASRRTPAGSPCTLEAQGRSRRRPSPGPASMDAGLAPPHRRSAVAPDWRTTAAWSRCTSIPTIRRPGPRSRPPSPRRPTTPVPKTAMLLPPGQRVSTAPAPSIPQQR